MSGVFMLISFVMIIVTIMLGIASLAHTLRFRQLSGKSLQIRKPVWVVRFCVFAIIELLIVSPSQFALDIYHLRTEHTETHSPVFHFLWWKAQFIENMIIDAMLIILASRCWLLYYDHSYEIALIDKKWRGAINPTDTNFWLSHRKTWGDSGFLLLFGIFVWHVILIADCVCTVFLFFEPHFLVTLIDLCLINIPCSLFIAALIWHGQKTKLFIIGTDKFSILNEMKYLSFSTLLIVLAQFMEIFVNDSPYLPFFTHAAETLFAFIAAYVQNRWVLNALNAAANVNPNESGELQGAPSATRVLTLSKSSNMSLRSVSSPATTRLAMTQVVRNRHGFAMFMRFCSQEMNVENLLFITEVAQYKARLHMAQSSDSTQSTSSSHSDKSGERRSRSSKRHSEDDKPLPSLARLTHRDVFGAKQKELKKFEGNVLQIDWLPISQQLSSPKERKKNKKNKNHDDAAMEMKEIEVTKTDMRQYAIDMGAEFDEDGNEIKRDEDEDVAAASDVTWMYNYAQYLFFKYIDSDAEFTINVSYHARQTLLLFFSKDMHKGFEFILNKHGISNQVLDKTQHQQYLREHLLKIERFLLNAFDVAMDEVWQLLACDTFLRFLKTPQYKYLCEKYEKQKLQFDF